jgi:catechol 2,3-dioxygenase-like lactoylglutathione lyase family enzyme
MQIVVASVPVDDQAKALAFYTEVLGFVKNQDIPFGESRWLTVVSPEGANGTELLLEPDSHPATRAYKKALVEDGIPWTSFGVTDVRSEFDRLTALGVPVHPATDGPGTGHYRRSG